MKKMNKILIYLVIPFAVFAFVERGYYSFIAPSHYCIEYATDEADSDYSTTTGLDLSDFSVTLTSGINLFSLKYITSERVIIPDPHYIQYLSFCIWQPPKIS
jgi:hypothetical protein